MGNGQCYVSGVFRITERLPFSIFNTLEYFGKIAGATEFGKAVPIEKLWGRSGNKWGMSSRSHLRYLFKQRHILWMIAKFIISYQGAISIPTKRTKLMFVHLLEER